MMKLVNILIRTFLTKTGIIAILSCHNYEIERMPTLMSESAH